MNHTSHANRTCRSLGLADDADTSLAFPSNWNYCYRSNPIAPPRFKHQEEFCLGGKYGECPLFLSRQAVPLPKNLRIPHSSSNKTRNYSRRNLVIALTIFIAVLVVGWKLVSQGQSSLPIGKATQTATTFVAPNATATSLPTATVLFHPILTSTATATLTVLSANVTNTHTPTSTRTPTPTITPTSTPSKHQLDVLIGTDYKFVIHKVLGGENLDIFAAKYNTSVESIVTVNYGLTLPIWVDVRLVIPVGFTDVARIPSFVVYQVKEEDRGSSVEDIAKNLGVSPLDLKYYNGWTNAEGRPFVGDLLLVPRPRAVP